MRKTFLPLLLLISGGWLKGGESGASEMSVPCNLTSGSCTRELELTPTNETPAAARNWWIQLVPPDSFEGMLEWRVTIWNGRKWEPETVLAFAPFCKERTSVRVTRKTMVRVRVSVFPEGARPPASDVAIVANSE